MKLNQFLAMLAEPLVAPFRAAADKVKVASDTKNMPDLLKSAGELVAVGAKHAEDVSEALKAAGNPGLTGPQKHEAVKAAVMNEIVEPAAQVAATSDNPWAKFFGTIANIVLPILIDSLITSTVARLNKNGWTV